MEIEYSLLEEIKNKEIKKLHYSWSLIGDSIFNFTCIKESFFQSRSRHFDETQEIIEYYRSKERLNNLFNTYGMLPFLEELSIYLYDTDQVKTVKIFKSLIGIYYYIYGLKRTIEFITPYFDMLDKEYEYNLCEIRINKISEKLEKHINYSFKNKLFLNLLYEKDTKKDSFQKLSLIGDKIIALHLSEIIYKVEIKDKYKFYDTILSNKTLDTFFKNSSLDYFFSKNISRAYSKRNSDYLEALVGALYLDGNFNATKDFFNTILLKHINQKLRK